MYKYYKSHDDDEENSLIVWSIRWGSEMVGIESMVRNTSNTCIFMWKSSKVV